MGAKAPIFPTSRDARWCAAKLDRRDTSPAPLLWNAVNTSRNPLCNTEIELSNVSPESNQRDDEHQKQTEDNCMRDGEQSARPTDEELDLMRFEGEGGWAG